MIRGKYFDGKKDKLDQCFEIRRSVFVAEQKITEDEEFDGLDEQCGHYIVYNEEDVPVATGRLIKISDTQYQIGRVATLKAWRHQGYAEFLMLALIEKARSLGTESIYLYAQLSAIGFYEKCGFSVESNNLIMDAGIEHKKMIYSMQNVHKCCECSQNSGY